MNAGTNGASIEYNRDIHLLTIHMNVLYLYKYEYIYQPLTH